VDARPVRIVIAGEHPLFREGLRRLLETEQGLMIVSDTSDASAVATLVRALQPDILLLSVTKSGPPAVEALRELVSSGVSVKTIILTESVDTPDVACALELGARGIVPKDSSPEMLFSSIKSAMAGHFWVGREEVSDVVPGLRKLEAARRRTKAFGLTKRELIILRDVVAGYTNKEIAGRSSISENTVKSHLTHIFNKLGASNRVELALFASHHRLLDGV